MINAIESSTTIVLVGAEVVDVRTPDSCGLQRREDRVDAVLHVKIDFSLAAVAENAQPVGSSRSAAVEVEDVAVRVALAEDRDEAEDEPRKPKPLAVAPDQPLRRRAWRRRRARSVPGTARPRASGRRWVRRRPSPSTRRRCVSTPSRMASSTLKVAIVFCSRSCAGDRVPCRHRRWRAGGRRCRSADIGLEQHVGVEKSPFESVRVGFTNSRRPVDRLSKPVTSTSSRVAGQRGCCR